MEQFEQATGQRVRFTSRAYEKFLNFATSSKATWDGNFRDLNAAITRMATLNTSGRIQPESVDAEIERLNSSWTSLSSESTPNQLVDLFDEEKLNKIDLFDQHQLDMVINTCRNSRSLSDASRKLYSASRLQKRSSNDSDRLRKYLAKFDLSWIDIV